MKNTDKKQHTNKPNLVFMGFYSFLSLLGRHMKCALWLIINAVAIFPARPYRLPLFPSTVYQHVSPPTLPSPRVHPNAVQTLFANLIQAEISLSDLAWPHFLLHINLLDTRHSQCRCLGDHLL